MSNQLEVTINPGGLTEEEAIKLANEIERIEAAAKTMKDKLKKYVETKGPLQTADKIWDLSESVSYAFTTEQLREVASHIALEAKNPWEYLSITSASLKKLEWTDEALNKLGAKKVTTRFNGRKK